MANSGFANPISTPRSVSSVFSSSSYSIGRYNTNDRKTEIVELRDSLIKSINERNEEEKLETVQKIILCMTIGIDVSELFQNIIMVSNTQDLLLKKMIYLYLGHYAKGNEQIAVLSVNSIVNDTHDDSPMIRGMAIRWLSSLNAPTLAEHMISPVKNGLIDISAYVRSNAALACAKVHRLNHDILGKDQGVINKLYELIRDKDPVVVVNSFCTLEEILANEGGVALNQAIVLHLLSHFHEFNAWGQCRVLKLLARYHINDEEELYGMMNALDGYFQNFNTAVVLATANCFLTFTETKPEIHKHVYMRLKDPLLTSLLGVTPELSYCILSHILLITKRIPTLFSDEYKQFYVKWKDPLYLKILKVKILQEIATDINTKDIIYEFSAYALDDPAEFSQESIRAIGRLAMRVPTVSELALEVLLGFLEMEQLQHVLATTLIALKDMLRRFPQIAQDVIPRLIHSLDVVEESNSIMAIITMIGEFGEIISDGPYILEEIINSWNQKDEKIRNQLLVSTLKLFFKRPKEVKPILGKLFKVACEDSLHPDVHDRALLFYRLLSSTNGIEQCKKVLAHGSTYVDQFVEEFDGFEIDRLFEEFDTLSVIYGKGSERFISEKTTYFDEDDIEQNRKAEEEEYYRNKREEEIRELEKETNDMSIQHQSHYTAPTINSNVTLIDTQPSEQMIFNPTALLDPPTFERTWRSLQVVKKLQLPYVGNATDPQQIDNFFQSHNVKSVAKGGTGGTLRFFLYAQENQSAALFLVELGINLQSRQVLVNIKSTHEQYVGQFNTLLQDLLQQL